MNSHQNGSGNGRMPRVRVAVVGLGYWGPNLVRNLHELPEAELVAVCDHRPEALGKMRRRFPAVVRRRKFERILDDHSIEAVVIATPVGTHHELAAAALAAEKHVFVEKPLAPSAEEAEHLVALARAADRVLMVGHTFLYSPAVNLIHDLIDSGQLGDLHFLSMSRVNLGIHQPDVSVIWDLAPHDFSILRYWLGENPAFVSGVSRACIIPERPDVAFVNLEYGRGTIAHVELAWLAPSKLRRTTIVGSRQMVVYDDGGLEPVRIFDSGVMFADPTTFGEYRLSYRTGDIVSPHVPAVEPLLLEMKDFCLAIRGLTQPRASAEIGLEVVRLIESVQHSFDHGGERVPVLTDALSEL